MELKQIDALLLKSAFLQGARNLEAKKEWINELNVFPVPDGDTGTNMTMTIMAAAREVAVLENPTMEELCKAISSGSLRGARGNSGVILSQLLRGFTRTIKDYQELDTQILARALQKATETAYKAVMKPKEGTILTVARGISEKAELLAPNTTDILDFFGQLLEEGDAVLARTPELLPVLKQAGVVDSGGQGLMEVLKGAMDGLLGKEVDYASLTGDVSSYSRGQGASDEGLETADIRFGYCTEFIINLEKEFGQEEELCLKEFLESIGDSIVCVADDDLIKIHVHTNDPGKALQKGLEIGSLSRIKIDNMREEHRERLFKDSLKLAREQKEAAQKTASSSTAAGLAPAGENTERKPFGFISVSAGDGLKEIFEGIGVDYVLSGGQTMNPSTEDILLAVEKVQAETIFILPNNKNIILAANQAAQLVENKNILVVPTTTIPQGITAVVNFVPEMSAQDNLKNMLQQMKAVRTLQVTYAVRDTRIDEFSIREGDIMAIGDEGLAAAGKGIEETAAEAVKKLVTKDTELISIYYGQEVDEASALSLSKKLKEVSPDAEIEVHEGGQPVYYYLIAVE